MILVCHASYVARPMRAIKPKAVGRGVMPKVTTTSPLASAVISLDDPRREATFRMKSSGHVERLDGRSCECVLPLSERALAFAVPRCFQIIF